MNELEKLIKNIQISGIIRKVDELGRVVIPIDYRKGKVEDGQTKVAIHQIRDYVIIEILQDQSQETTKKFDELGRVVVNIEIRNELNWKEKDQIEVWNFGRYFILKKVEDKCVFCSSKKKSLIEYKGKLVCRKCKEELVEI